VTLRCTTIGRRSRSLPLLSGGSRRCCTQPAQTDHLENRQERKVFVAQVMPGRGEFFGEREEVNNGLREEGRQYQPERRFCPA
jgi:hypothetical protein